MLSCIWLFADPWTVADQAPLSMKFSRHKNSSRLPFPSPRHLPHWGVKSTSLTSPALAGEFFTTEPPGKPNTMHNLVNLNYLSMRGDYFYIMKCAHSKRNQDNWKAEGESLTQQLLLWTNLDVTVWPLLPQVFLMLTQPLNHNCTFFSQTQPLLTITGHMARLKSPPSPPMKNPWETGSLLLPVRTLTGLVHYLDEILKYYRQQVIHMSNNFGEMI